MLKYGNKIEDPDVKLVTFRNDRITNLEMAALVDEVRLVKITYLRSVFRRCTRRITCM